MNSNLQIISGKLRGKKLFLPANARPTQNKARIAIFNMLMSGIFDFTKDFKVWDVFAGSGAVGCEFLSRFENANVLFTDLSSDSIKTIQKNVDNLPNAKIVRTDANSDVAKYGADIDIVFIDPPYELHHLGSKFMASFEKIAKSGAIVVWESESDKDVKISDRWEILRDKKYGRARFVVIKLK